MCAFKSAVCQASYIELLLARSNACPLDIYVYYVREGVPSVTRMAFETRLFHNIRRVVNRWRTVRMNVPAECVDGGRLEMFKSDTQLLEELCLDLNFRQGCRSPFLADEGESWGTIYLPFCPRLRTLVLHNIGWAPLYPKRWIPCPFIPLEELDIRSSGLDPYEQVRLLGISPDLVTLRFCNFRMFPSTTSPHAAMLNYPRLKDLTIPSMAPRLLAAWAPGLIGLHNLETLDMTGHAYRELANVLRFVRPTVTTLSFTLEDGDLCPDSNATLLRRLARLARLRELRIERAGTNAPQELFRALCDGERRVWPDLQAVQLRSADLRSDDEAGMGHGYITGAERAAQALLDFIFSRNAPRAIRKEESAGRTPRARLTRVVLFGCQIDPAILAGMRVLVPVEERPGEGAWLAV
ncbi:hypothetical protein AURDEDRAFT_123307 [Auricularia subglabra TFB-10046 SS5]|nr:hypothetical protein AURDEDRAFT_123307 [Auricularia subglabra TFB-10046 SS5]